ncbi:MAG: pseudaminic acid synthase [Candidatus Eremiobacteraeota bacterium]|nr:pseudaminic acid synthase [Candidatus Eremiobacteraeota bacterium]
MAFKMAGQTIGDDNSCFIVAELSSNHAKNLEIAINTIKAIKESGADAVKLQTYTPESMTLKSEKDFFRIRQGTIWDGKTLYDLYEEAYTPWEWHSKLKTAAEELGLVCFSAPFDKAAVDFLEDLNFPAYKVASFEITDIPLIRYIASKGKPIILSTGIANLSEIEEAVNVCRSQGNLHIALLKCTSAYPAPFDEINLKTIPDLLNTFNAVIGLSDHTMGYSVAIASIALGAKIVEKHFILDRSLKTPDASFSMEPHEFRAMVSSIKEAEKAMGKVSYDLTESTMKSREFARSLFVVQDIQCGDVFTEENIRSIRPGFGLHPRYLDSVLGRKSHGALSAGTPLQWEMIDK